MKTLSLIIAFLFIINFAFSQGDTSSVQESEFKTLIKKPNHKLKVSGFGAINVDFGYANDNIQVLPGLDLATLIERKFFIGVYGRMLATPNNYEYTYYNGYAGKNVLASQNAIFGHGGLLVGGVFFANNPIHFGVSGRFGVGVASLYDTYDKKNEINFDEYYDYPYSNPVFVCSPQVDFEMNLTYWMKFRLSAGYQYVSSSSVNYAVVEDSKLVEKELFNTSDYSTPTVTLGFVFGWFK